MHFARRDSMGGTCPQHASGLTGATHPGVLLQPTPGNAWALTYASRSCPRLASGRAAVKMCLRYDISVAAVLGIL